ncbi:hypothetical protein ACJX0J_034310, partial [Zea mays]
YVQKDVLQLLGDKTCLFGKRNTLTLDILYSKLKTHENSENTSRKKMELNLEDANARINQFFLALIALILLHILRPIHPQLTINKNTASTSKHKFKSIHTTKKEVMLHLISKNAYFVPHEGVLSYFIMSNIKYKFMHKNTCVFIVERLMLILPLLWKKFMFKDVAPYVLRKMNNILSLILHVLEEYLKLTLMHHALLSIGNRKHILELFYNDMMEVVKEVQW